MYNSLHLYQSEKTKGAAGMQPGRYLTAEKVKFEKGSGSVVTVGFFFLNHC